MVLESSDGKVKQELALRDNVVTTVAVTDP